MAKKKGLNVKTYKPKEADHYSPANRVAEEAERLKKQREEERYAAAMAQQGITKDSTPAQRRIADEMLRMRQANQPKLRQEEMTRALKGAGQGTGFTSQKLYNFQNAAADARISNIGKKLDNEEAIIKKQGRAEDDPARIRAQEEYAKALEELSAAKKKKEELLKPRQQLLPSDRISLDGGRTAYSAEEEAEIRKIQGRIEKNMSKFPTIPAMYDPKVKEDIHNLNMAAVKTDKDYISWLKQGADAGLYNDEQTKLYRENYFHSNLPDSRNTREYSAYIRNGIEQGIFDGGEDIAMMSSRKLHQDIEDLKARRKTAEDNREDMDALEAELYNIGEQKSIYKELGEKGLQDPMTQTWHKGRPEDYSEWGRRGGVMSEDQELKYYYDSLLYNKVHGENAYQNVYENGTDEDFDRMDDEIQEMWRRMEDGTIGQMGEEDATRNQREAELRDITTDNVGNIDRQIEMREEELERRRQQGEFERSTEGAEYNPGLDYGVEGAISDMRKTSTGDKVWEYATSPEATYVLVNEAARTAADTPINGNVIDQGANLYQAEKEYRKYAHMTPKMVDTFNGLYAQDKDKAMAYLKTLEPYLNSMQGDYVAGFREMAARGGMGALYGAETILTQPVAGIEGTVGTVLSLLGNKDAQNKYSGWYKNITRNQQIRGARAQSWGDFFADTFGEQYRGAGEWLNGVTYSIADNLMAMATAKAGGAVFGYDMASDTATRLVQTVMSGEATASAMAEALEKNMDPAEAAIRAIGNGLIEAATEKYSIEALLKPDVKEMLGNWGQIGKFLLKNTVAEGAEEGASDILNTVWDEMLSSMYGHESELMAEYNQLRASGMGEKEASRQVWKNWLAKTGSDMAAGALSGMLMSGGRVAMNTYNQIREGRTIRGANNTIGTKTGADQLIEAARGMNEGSVSRQMAEDMFEAAKKGKKASNRDVGRLAQNMAKESNEEVAQIAEGTVDRMVREELGNKGVTVEVVDQVAPIITQAAMTDSTAAISKADRSALAQDKRIIETFKDFMSDGGRIATGMAVAEEAKQPLSVRETVGSLLKGDNVESMEGEVAREAAESAVRAEENLATEEEIREAEGRKTNTGLDAVWNGNLVQVIGLKDGKYQLKTAEGIATANITDVAAAGAQLGTVMDFIGRSGLIDDAAASAMITGIRANPNLSGGKYAAEAMNVYMAARTGSTYETAALDTETADAIRKAAEQQNAQEREDRLKKGEGQKHLAPGEGKTTYDGAEFGTDAWKEKMKGLNSVQRGQANVLAEMVRVSGNELELVNDEENDGVFGWEEDTGKITINLAAKDSSGAAMNRSLLTIAGHELTHFLEQNSREGYDQLRQYVFDRLRTNGGDVASLVMNKIDRYRTIKGQENIGIEGAMAEIVADACDQVLLNRKTAEAMQQEYSGMAGKVRNFAKGFIQRWENATKVKSNSYTSRALMEQGEEVMNQIAENWNIARREAAGQREGAEAVTGSRQMSAREDSEGRQLTPKQQEFFKDSKAVDNQGRLMPLYHGTMTAGFNVFSKTDDIGYFFTDDRRSAETYVTKDDPATYAPTRDGNETADQSSVYEVYLNLKNPMIIDGNGGMFNSVVDTQGKDLKMFSELDEDEIEQIAENMGMTPEELEEKYAFADDYEVEAFDTDEMIVHPWKTTREWVSEAKEKGYDGVIFRDIMDTASEDVWWTSDVYVAMDSNQIKSVNNTEPTSSQDIRFSVQENGDITDEDGEPIAKVLDGGTVAQYSQRTWDEDDKDALIRTLVDRGFKEKDVKGWIRDVNGIAAKIAEDPQRLDYEATSYNRMLKNNQEYVKTLDTSTLCAKRLLYQGIYNEIQHMLPNTPLLPEDLINLVNLMKKKGQVTPCGICYVESRRKQLGKYASDWLKGYDGEYKPRLEELTTTDGLEDLRENHRKAYDDFIAAMNAKGSANPKVVQLRTEYRGDIREMTDSQIKKVKEIGGLRVQSFSDFETVHLIDMMQAVLDMAAKDLTSQAYTKVPAFAWVFGDTGMKINLSLIGKDGGVDADGNLIFDDIEGMPFDEAMAIRDAYSANVGTILVGMNDAHIIAAMADDRIDFIIPFHKSGWSKKEMSQVIGMGAYKDYTRWQNEKKIAGKKANGKGYQTIPNKTSKIQNFGPVGPSGKWDGQSGYWDFSKTGTQNAERYLQLCAEDKRMPKFANFLVDNGDGTFRLPTEAEAKNDKRAAAVRKGYWKLLIDFKMYDNEGNGSPQTTVKPNFNMERAYQILKDFEGGANKLPTNHGIAREFVEQYKKAHPRKSYSARETDAEYEKARAKDDRTAMREILDNAAKRAGYTEKVYHGTDAFGFTVADVRQGDDMMSFFATDNVDVAGTYAYDAGIREIKDRVPFSVKDLKTKEGFWRSDEGVLKYLDQLGIEYKDGGKDEFRHKTYEIPEWGDKGQNKLIPGMGPRPYRGTIGDISFQLYGKYLERNNINTQFGVAPQAHTTGIYQLYANTDGMLEIDGGFQNWDRVPYDLKSLLAEERAKVMEEYPDDDPIPFEWEDDLYEGEATTRQIAQYAKMKGYSGVVIRNIKDNGGKTKNRNVPAASVYIFFSPEQQTKSADLVTYDDEGKVIPPSRRFSGENNDLRFSVRDEGDMDVQAWMLTLKPEDLRTEQERLMLKQYKDLRMAVDLARYNISDLRTRIRAVERRMREKGTNVADREALRKLNNKYSEGVDKLHRMQERLAKVTTQEGYAAMMYRESGNMERLVKGKTVKQVQQSVEALTAAAQRTQKRIEEREKKIREMADTEAVKQIQTLLTGGHLDQMAAWLRKTYQSSMNKQQLMAEMSAIRLKMAAGQDVTAEGEELAWKLLYGIQDTRDSVLMAMRGITLKLGPKQVKELYGSDMTMKELRSRLAGTGIKVVQAEKSGLDGNWQELREDVPELPEDAKELEQVKAVLDLVENRKRQAMNYGANKYGGNIADVTADVLAATAAVNMDKPKDPQAMAILKRMNRLITNMAGTMTQSTDVLAEAREQIGELVQHGRLASDMTQAMQKNVEDAIRYNNALVEQSEAVTWNGERLKLINQMKEKHTQEMLEQQEKWREKIAKDKAARDLQAENLQTRQKINRNIVRIRNLLMNETDIKNIPEHMKSLARTTLAYIVNNDISGRKISGISKEDLAETARLLTAWNMQDGKFDISDLQMIDDEEAQAMVADALADIEDGIAEYNGDTKGKDAIQNMTMFKNALEKILSGVATVKNVIDAERTIAFMDRKVAVTDAAMDIMNAFPAMGGKGELKGRGAKAMNAVIRSVGYGNETPVYFFKNLNNKGIDALWNGMQGAENRNGLLIQETQAWMDKLAEETHYASWDHEKKYTVKLNGAPVQMTIEQMMAVYATWQREQKFGPENSSHMEDGGIYLEDEDGETEKLHREKKPQRARRVKQGDIEAIEKMFTEDQKKYIDAVIKYLSNNMSELGNEASMRMYGIRKYKEDYYFPMKIWNGVKSARSDKGISGTDDNRIAHQGWSKRRRNNAQNALVIGNFTDTAVKHMVEMINYATFAPEIENLNKVLNWQYIEEEMDEDENGRHVAENRRNIRVMFQENYGKEALRYLEEFMKDLQGGAVQDQRKTLRDKALTIFKKNAVAGSLSVAAQQPLSYIRAAMMIDPKYLAEAILPGNNKGSYTERMKYSGVSVIKEMGRFDMNFGQSARDFIMPEAQTKGVKAVMDKAAEATTKLPEIMDRVTWNRMWTAVKLEQAAKNPDADTKSEEFLKKVGERFNEVMRMTQVYDSTLVKSSNMRSQNLSMKILTSFMAEPTLSLNVLADAVRNAKTKGGKINMARAGATFLLSAVLQAMVKGLIGTGRTPDEKKTWMENFLYKWQMNLQSEVNPFGLIPGYSDIIELLKNGELKDDAMGALGKIKSIITTAQNAFNPEKSKGIYRDIEDSAAQLAQLFTNVPAKNLMRDARAIFNWVSGSTYAARPTSGAVVRQQALETAANADSLLGVLNQYLGESGYRTTNTAYYNRMFEAVQNGNQAEAEEIREYLTQGKGVAESTIDSNIRSKTRENALFPAMENNKADEIKKAIQTMQEYGAEVKDIKSAITKEMKPKYLAGNVAEKVRIRDAIQKAYKAMGLTAEDANKVIDGWK